MDLNSAGFGHMFPYSNIHELNIDWLLVTVKEMEAKVVSLEGRIADAEQRIEDHEARMQLLETEVATLKREWDEFKQYVENRFDELEQNIRDLFIELEARIDAQFARLETEIDTRFTQLEHDIDDKFTTLESDLRLEIQNVLRYIIDTCAEFTAKVTALEGRVAQIESDMQDCCVTISGKLDEVLDALDQINPELREKVITQNGVYLAADDGAVGFWKVTVNVDTGTSVLVPLEVTANGTYNPETGTDGFSSVVVNVPQAGFTTQEKTATENGVVTPDAGYDGLSKVTVDVPQRTAEALTITQNGTTQTPAGKYYDPITVDVPQRTAEALTITQNGTRQTPAGKYYDPIVVNVPSAVIGGNVGSGNSSSNYYATGGTYAQRVTCSLDNTQLSANKISNAIFYILSGISLSGRKDSGTENVTAHLEYRINSITQRYADGTSASVIHSQSKVYTVDFDPTLALRSSITNFLNMSLISVEDDRIFNFDDMGDTTSIDFDLIYTVSITFAGGTTDNFVLLNTVPRVLVKGIIE